MEESAGAQLLPLPATLEPISRPSSTSTTASATMPQLPGISAIAAAATASATSSPQLRPTNTLPTIYPAASPAGTAAASGGNLPTCQNCSTSTTPLWRRDEMGSVLCNACGLFLKLHGRPRPISLKTDVIKSRNRVKTMRPELGMKKKNPGVATDANGAELQAQQAAAAALGARRASQKSANGHVDGSHSPVSRTATPNMYGSHLPLYHGVEDPQLHAQGLQGFVSATADGRAASPMNGERLDIPQTHEQLVATNSSLKTRVSELEVINDFIRGRLEQYESYGAGPREGQDAGPTEAQLRAQLDTLTKSETQLRTQLDESHRRENNLKRRLDEMEVELKEAKEALEVHENGRAKKLRVSDMVEESETSTPQSTS